MSPITASVGDLFSPMLVKELRQGMRSGLFVWSFLLLQIVMTFAVLGMLYASSENESPEFVTGLFWICIGLPLLLTMPMSGLNSLGSEIKGNTLELIFLTRLSAWRIVLGKWLALVVQSLLLVSAILPYLVLRYFVGGVNIVSELETLGSLLLASAVLSALTVAISPFESKLLRIALVFGLIFGLQVIPSLFFYVGIGGAGGRLGLLLSDYVFTLLAITPLALVLLLAMAAGKIAPPADNYATRRRLLGLLTLAVVSILSLWQPEAAPLLLFVSLFILLPLVIAALCEHPVMIASVYRPFTRCGWAGRLAGRFLYPGWPSAVFFTALVLAWCGWLLVNAAAGENVDSEDLNRIRLGGFAATGALFMPVALTNLLMHRYKRRVALFLLIQIIMVLAAIAVPLIGSMMDTPTKTLLAPFPTAVLALMITGNISANQLGTFSTVAAITTAGSVLLCVWQALAALRRLAPFEKPAAGSPAAVPTASPEQETLPA